MLITEAKDLIKKCLQFDPFVRISLKDIAEHTWVKAPTADWFTLSASASVVSPPDSDGDNAEVEVVEGTKPTDLR